MATVPAKVIEFYEPRVLAAGYKLMSKDLSDPEDADAVYTGPNGILVLTVDNPDQGAREVEIVSVQGDLGGLAALSRLKGMPGASNANGKAPQAAPNGSPAPGAQPPQPAK